MFSRFLLFATKKGSSTILPFVFLIFFVERRSSLFFSFLFFFFPPFLLSFTGFTSLSTRSDEKTAEYLKPAGRILFEASPASLLSRCRHSQTAITRARHPCRLDCKSNQKFNALAASSQKFVGDKNREVFGSRRP